MTTDLRLGCLAMSLATVLIPARGSAQSVDGGVLPPELIKCGASQYVDLSARDQCPTCLEISTVPEAGEALTRIFTSSGGSGRNSSYESVWWSIDSRTCRSAGLQINGGAGSPWADAAFIRPDAGPEVTAAEQKRLLAWAGYVAFSAADPRDQLAAAPPLPELIRTPANERGADEKNSSPQIIVSPRGSVRWLPSPPQHQRTSWKAQAAAAGDRAAQPAGPRFDIFSGDSFQAAEKARAGDKVLHIFRTAARNTSDALALYDPAKNRTGWVGMTVGPTKFLGVSQGYAWVQVPVRMETEFRMLGINLNTGGFRVIGFEPAGAFAFQKLGTAGVQLTNEHEFSDDGKPRSLVVIWRELLKAMGSP